MPALNDEVREYATDALLRDGGSVHIRAIRPADQFPLLRFFETLSARSVYFRFFQTKTQLTDRELRYFTELDFVRHVGLAATLWEHGEEHIIAVGRYICPSTEAPLKRAEVAFAVADAHQGRGLGTLLLDHLAEIARKHGITEFEADVLGENNRMLQVFAASGFEVKRSVSHGVFHVTFPTAETERFRSVQAEREHQATAQSIRTLLHPRSIAVVGASERAGSIGAALLGNLIHHGFTGSIYPVNPRASILEGLPAFATVSAIEAPVDLAIIAVPATAVEASIRDCAQAGVHSVVVISSGFGEVSGEGRETEARLRQLVRGAGMRLVGPNCMGILNTDPEVSMNGVFTPVWPPAGNIGMLSQSGALGLAILDYVHTRNVGISTFLSVGNRADVSSNDLLAYWADDPRTDVIVLYLESFGNPRKFARIAPDVAKRKPVIAMKSGRSIAGTRAASSHSASLANLDVAVDALFEQAGVIRTQTLEELFDVATLMATQPIPSGSRVGVVTNAGGPGIALADACESLGLTLPELEPQTQSQLRAFLPPQAGFSNPVDMIASATPEQFTRTIEAVGNDPNIDALAVIYIPPLVTDPEEIAQAIASGAGAVPGHKPVLNIFISTAEVPSALNMGSRGVLPAYRFPENAAHALAAAARYGRWRARPQGESVRLSPFAHDAVRAVVDRALADHDEPVWLSPADFTTILGAAGIACAVAEQTIPSEATEAAHRLGYPLVAKVVSPDVLHKSDVGGVIMGLHTEADVEQAALTLGERMRHLGARLDGILLQREVASGIEAFVGVTSDPTFGPLVVCGLGGTLVEVLHDVAFRLPPVTDRDAAEMLSSLRTNVLLDGYRGAPPGDRDALVDLIMRVSALVESVPELLELDLNPIKILPPDQGATVVDGRMRLGPLAS
ncbi:bifunctional acetate--CoA ligase family protein/GNAT family N-acetyltransferase [Candidatus Entotheonella palauensis]|uniref:bifunctional acetate--CoA ligase family protein/GNAT family N-acetyltransferase n=1 Tax=Candidatus Entotheonella palauensis TaxID=93172 RepID=UPI000B7CF2B3|nr:bifunctional GNAT family N-acetyltransferase/acetate--CoA ligase family protein [Candidatus Entotheonella palauensis]